MRAKWKSGEIATTERRRVCFSSDLIGGEDPISGAGERAIQLVQVTPLPGPASTKLDERQSHSRGHSEQKKAN